MSVMLSKINGVLLSPVRDEPRARRLLPQTMTGLVAAGCLLAAAPLLVALVMAGVALQDLSRRAESLVEEGLAVTSLGAELQDQVFNLERNARQYVALSDPELLPVVADRIRETHSTLTRIGARNGLRMAFVEHVAKLRQGLTDAGAAWGEGLQSGSLLPALDKIHTLAPEADAIVSAGRDALSAQVAHLRDASAQARRVMLLSAVALLPLTGMMVFGFSIVVTRPLRQVGSAISGLGHAEYSTPIDIPFPREMQRLGERLDWLRRRLADLEADKDRFLRHVSHELKTPLAALAEGAELLREGALGPLTERQTEVAEIMSEAAGELSGQISNLLAYAEWRDERRTEEARWFDARALVDEVFGAHALTMERRGLGAELDLRAPRLFGHRSQLRAALGNLVANAVKYAPEGSAVVVHVDVVDGCCELWVQDSGRGVPDHEKSRIFEPFVRGAADEVSSYRGTGIGLSIVRETAIAHGGTVAVDDAHPGARFRLRWPVREARAASRQVARHDA